MAKFINPVDNGFRSSTAGERRFARCLKTLLEDDYLCWYDVPIGPKRQHPDFVILHPRRGLLVLEVKDWKIETLRRVDKHHVDLLLESGSQKRVLNPIEQARGYAHTVVDRLASDQQLQAPSGNHRGKLCFPYGYGVVLTNITRRQLDQALSESDQEFVLPPRLVICKDEMSESGDAMEFQERLSGMFQYTFGEALTLPQLERVRWHLFPEIRISCVQEDLFNPMTPSEDSDDAAIPELVRVMDLQQEQLARSLGGGHRVIHGVAGSGKTLILGYRCLHLAQTTDKPVLVLCFNITLAARLDAFVKQRGIAEKVHVHHFHGWCKTQLETYHVNLISSAGEIWDRQVSSVIAGVESGWIPRAQYGAVMIDEGHDFEPEWFKLVVQMIDAASDSLLLLYDDAQSIYRRSNGLKFSLSSVGIRAPGRTTILRLNYRNTREILTLAYDFARSFISPQSADEDHIPLIEPEAGGISGPRPVFLKEPNIEAEIESAVGCVKKWSAAGEPLNEIAVVYSNWKHGRMIQRSLEHERIAHLWMDTAKGKHAYDPSSPRVSVLPVQSSKGLEFKSVIFLGLGHFPDRLDEGDRAKLIYVGMTRARENLVLLASLSNDCTERVAALAA